MIFIVIAFGFALIALGEDGMRRLDVPGQTNIALFEIGCAVFGACVLAIAYAWVEINENRIDAQREVEREKTRRGRSSSTA